MLRLYVANSTANPLGWKPWNSRLQGHQLGAYFQANFAVPDPNEVGPRLAADFPNYASVRTGVFRSRDSFNAPRPRNYAPPELVRAGLAWLGAENTINQPQLIDMANPIPFDPAEFSPTQINIPEQANPQNGQNPGGIPCPAWGCGGPRIVTPMPVLNPPPVVAPSTGGTATGTVPPRLQTLFAQWQAQQNAAQLALAQQQAAAAAAAVAIPVPNAVTPATATASPDYVGEVESWLTQQTLISGVPNWAIGAGVVGALLFLHKKSGR